jgi:hypothetical protein
MLQLQIGEIAAVVLFADVLFERAVPYNKVAGEALGHPNYVE